MPKSCSILFGGYLFDMDGNESRQIDVIIINDVSPLKEGRYNQFIRIRNYDDWPYKIVYVYDGIEKDTAFGIINNFYEENKAIPFNKRPKATRK